jgi:hypothetical protein
MYARTNVCRHVSFDACDSMDHMYYVAMLVCKRFPSENVMPRLPCHISISYVMLWLVITHVRRAGPIRDPDVRTALVDPVLEYGIG